MSSVSKTNESTDLRHSADASGRAELNEIDRSARGPALVFIAAGTLWLVVSSCLAFVASFKLHTPDFLSQCEFFTYGRVFPAATNTFIYGWGINIAFAVGLWIMARLSNSLVPRSGYAVVAALFWNIGVLLGTIGILKGDSLGLEWLEFPTYVTPLLFIAYLVMGVVGISIFRYRKSKQTYVSQWLILAAFFCFPWIYSVTQFTLICEPGRGVMQAIANAWFVSSLSGLWFIALGLAGLYYLVPKILGSGFRYYKLMNIGFWSLIISASFGGGSSLVGGPVPAWIISVGIAASLLMIVPVAVAAVNYFISFKGRMGDAFQSTVLRFVMVGLIAFLLFGLSIVMTVSRSAAELIHLTLYRSAESHLVLYGFFSMVMFGCVYYLLPRLLQREWPSAMLIKVHFTCSVFGLILYVVALTFGGIVQGTNLDDVANFPELVSVIEKMTPFLFSQTVAIISLLLGHVAFATSFFWILLKPQSEEEASGEFLNNPSTKEVKA